MINEIDDIKLPILRKSLAKMPSIDFIDFENNPDDLNTKNQVFIQNSDKME